MRTTFLLILIMFFAASLVFAQIGSKQGSQAIPDTTQAKGAGEVKKSDVQKVQETAPEKIVPAKSSETATASSSHVKRALFTTAVEAREPAGSVDSLSTESDQVYFFTEIIGLEGHTVTHRWMYNGEVLSEVPFSIGAPRWRVFSSKKLLQSWIGALRVDVVDDAGSVLLTKQLKYYKAKSTE